MATTESRVAGTILQRKIEIQVDGVTYEVAPPTCETLILYSEEISNIQAGAIDTGKPVQELNRVGKSSRPLGYALAILILGPNALIERRRVWYKGRFGIPRRKTVTVDKKKELGDELLLKGPGHLANLAVALFQALEVKNFMTLITSLAGLNLLKPTRVVSNKKTTASGRSSTVRRKT